MKHLQKIGLILFLVGIVFFTFNVFQGSFKLTEDKLKEYFRSRIDEKEWSKADSISANVVLAAKELGVLEKSYDSKSDYFDALDQTFELHNSSLVENWYGNEALTEEDISTIYEQISTEKGIIYNQGVIDTLFASSPLKAKSLSEGTNWMFQDQRSYDNLDAFKIDIEGKVNEINSSLGNNYQLQHKNGRFLRIARLTMESNAKSNPFLWFMLTFGLVIIGTLIYLLPTIKLWGPAGIKNNGIYHSSLTNKGWIAWLVTLYLVSIYLLLYFAPQYLVNNIILVDGISNFLSGNNASEWFLYGFMYCVAMTLMAVRMYIKYRHNAYQIFRTTVVLFFQLVFAFLIPELLVRFQKPYYDFKNAWPLDYDFFFDWNIKTLIESDALGIFMFVWGISLTFLIVPIMVYFFGKRWYCSWVCGCGGLAETLGDPYRQNSDKSLKAWKLERYLIHSVLVFAILMTAAAIYSFFHDNPEGYWLTQTHFVIIISLLSLGVMALTFHPRGVFNKISKKNKLAVYIVGGLLIALSLLAMATDNSNILFMDTYTVRWTYGLLIGYIFSGVIGTGFYPIFGNRVWCRFGCPLAAYMGLVQRFKSRFRITTNGGQCISCGNCSTYCEQGIDVRAYAQKGEDIVRSSCLGCGVCSAVCPRGVLKLENSGAPKKIDDNPLIFENNMFKINPDV